MKTANAFSIALVGSLLLPAPVLAQATKAGVVAGVHGTATVARATAPDAAPLRFKDDVYFHDKITTGENSIARILLGGKALVTARERSVLTITETPTISTIEVTSGAVALSVVKSRMNPGQSIEIRTPNAVAGIRGTVIIAEVEQDTTRFTLLSGVVDVAQLDPVTGQPSSARLTLNPLQSVDVVGLKPPTAPQAITKDEARKAAGEFKVNLRSPSQTPPTELTQTQMQQAAEQVGALVKDTARPRNDEARSDEPKNGVVREVKDRRRRDRMDAALLDTGEDPSTTGSAPAPLPMNPTPVPGPIAAPAPAPAPAPTPSPLPVVQVPEVKEKGRHKR